MGTDGGCRTPLGGEMEIFGEMEINVIFILT